MWWVPWLVQINDLGLMQRKEGLMGKVIGNIHSKEWETSFEERVRIFDEIQKTFIHEWEGSRKSEAMLIIYWQTEEMSSGLRTEDQFPGLEMEKFPWKQGKTSQTVNRKSNKVLVSYQGLELDTMGTQRWQCELAYIISILFKENLRLIYLKVYKLALFCKWKFFSGKKYFETRE